MQERASEIFLTKSDEWAYEEEYRIIGRTKDTTPGQTQMATKTNPSRITALSDRRL
jgi:hypothetical protein